MAAREMMVMATSHPTMASLTPLARDQRMTLTMTMMTRTTTTTTSMTMTTMSVTMKPTKEKRLPAVALATLPARGGCWQARVRHNQSTRLRLTRYKPPADCGHAVTTQAAIRSANLNSTLIVEGVSMPGHPVFNLWVAVPAVSPCAIDLRAD